MSVRSQRHLREFYGIDSAGESDGPQTPVPALALDFITLTPETLAAAGVAYSGPSLRMRYDETGKLTYSPNNLLLYSNDLSTTWNDLSSGTTTRTGGQADPFGGTTASLLVGNDLNTWWGSGAGSGLGGKTVILSVWLRRDVNPANDNERPDLTAYFPGGSASTSITCTVSTTWQKFFLIRQISASETGAPVFALNVKNGNHIYACQAQYEAVTYETTPRTYHATTANRCYGPRFDYDPVTHEAKGILIEEQRTNTVIYSRPNVATLGWDGSGSQGAVMTENAAIAPDGTLSATHIHETISGPPYHGIQTDAFARGSSAIETWTGSIYAKSAERTVVDLEIGNYGLYDGAGVFYDLTTGDLISQFDYGGTYHVVGTSIEDVGNGWWRATITVTTDTDSQIRLWIGTGYNGVGDDISGNLLWGAQIEKGAFATSLIVTVATALTRTADLAAMTGSNFTDWFNASEGTFVVDWGASLSPSAFNGPIANQYAPWLGCTGNDANYGSSDIQVGGTTSWGGTLGTAISAGQSAGKGAVAYSSAGGSLALNGVSSTASGAVVVGYPSGDFFIGSNLNGYHWNGCIKSVQFYNTRLTDAQLQALTT